jgi:hypothetical protein
MRSKFYEQVWKAPRAAILAAAALAIADPERLNLLGNRLHRLWA